MTIPDAVQTKLARSDDLVSELDETIKHFFSAKPYEARRVISEDGREHVLEWVRFTPPPATLGSIAGDAIHNLRTSLDHMVVALARHGSEKSGIEISSADLRKLKFPVTPTLKLWREQLRRNRLYCVEESPLSVIEQHQPFNVTPKSPGLAHIATLADLDNADKHHDPIKIELAPSVVRCNWPKSLEEVVLKNPYPPEDRSPGSEFARFSFANPQLATTVPIEFRWGFTMWVGYWNNFDVRYAIGNYSRIVRFLIDALARYLP